MSRANKAISAWFAQAHPSPLKAYAEWRQHGVALLPLGRRFDAIRVAAARVHVAVGSSAPSTVAAALADWLHGPVVRDQRPAHGPYYVLISPAEQWVGDERLSTTTYLGIPRVGDPGEIITWVVPPAYPGALCDIARLRALLLLADGMQTQAVEP
ncbi:hypothetical protein [Streptomyces sp. G45]|uniref:hypothetical protein n=1 Tax=Streptomyces sp. G45 TaxID=3406627 RepID=UPI003C1F4611